MEEQIEKAYGFVFKGFWAVSKFVPRFKSSPLKLKLVISNFYFN